MIDEPPADLRSVPPEEQGEPVTSLGEPPTEVESERDEAIIQAAWSFAAFCDAGTRAIERWAMGQEARAEAAQPPADPEPWRCGDCGSRMQNLGEGRYGCARTHAPVLAPAEAMKAERDFNARATSTRRP